MTDIIDFPEVIIQEEFPIIVSQSANEYDYWYLLNRLKNMQKDDQDEQDTLTECEKKLSIPAPQLAKDGTRKMVILNFGAIADKLGRTDSHLSNFLRIELATTVSLNPDRQFTFKGKYKTVQIQSVLRNYIKKYVMCRQCKKIDTELLRDQSTRLWFVKCKNCGSSHNPDEKLIS